MKTNILTLATLLLAFFLTSNSKTQTIDSLKIIPINPTTTDTVKVILYAFSAYTPCDIDSIVFETIGNNITVRAYIVSGNGPATCYSKDTLIIGILDTGSYELICNLNDSYQPIITYNSDTIYFTIQQTVGIKHIEDSNRIINYPNPVSNWLNISLENKKYTSGKIKIEMFDVLGKIVLSQTQLLGNESLKVNVATIKNGNYLFKLTFADGSTDVFKVVVNR